jgi:hypothetical protein
MSNSLWRIAFGDYDLSVDRGTLTYRLVETKTGTVWADGLSLGWMAVEERATGAVTRHDFGAMRILSIAEKSAAMGKRILFGLDLDGIPVDVYVIAGLREVQMIVEANRDSATHRVHGFGLLPGVCSVPDDGRSHIILPLNRGVLISATDVHTGSSFPPFYIWRHPGITMPFCGAVVGKDNHASAIALLTDSVYGEYHLRRSEGGRAEVDLHFAHDPERRRLDLRIVVVPDGDHVSIARAYRDKIIEQNNHITLRRKIRVAPEVEQLIGAAWMNPACEGTPQHLLVGKEIDRVVLPGVQLGESMTMRHLVWTSISPQEGVKEITISEISPGSVASHNYAPSVNGKSLWDTMDAEMSRITAAKNDFSIVGSMEGADWRYIAVDYVRGNWLHYQERNFQPVPLFAVVYHDSVVTPFPIRFDNPYQFLDALLLLSPPEYIHENVPVEYLLRTYAVLSYLHRLTFPAFLTNHRFLQIGFDGEVEEVQYSDGTRVLVNQRIHSYENAEFHLPPIGFYARHPQMEAHDALRIGDRTFETRAWRIRRSLDGRPLEQSENILTQEFPVPPGA